MSLQLSGRTGEQLKQELIALIPTLAPNWTAHGEDEPGMVFIDMLAGLADGVNFFVDKQALENYITTMRLRKSALRLARLFHYRPKRIVAASGIMNFSATQSLPYELFFPKGTQFQTQTGIKLTSSQAIYHPVGSTATLRTFSYLAQKIDTRFFHDGSETFSFQLADTSVCEQDFILKTGDIVWTEINDLLPEQEQINLYVLSEDDNGNYFINFNDTYANLPLAGTEFNLTYLVPSGTSTSATVNVTSPSLDYPVGISEADKLLFDASLDAMSFLIGAASGYKPKESLNEIKLNMPTNLRYQRRNITEDDYKDTLKQQFDVRDVALELNDFYARSVIAYVLPNDFGTPTTDELDAYAAAINARNMYTEIVTTQAPVYKNILCQVRVFPNEGFNQAEATYVAQNAIEAFFNSDEIGFAYVIEEGQLHAAVRALDEVSYLRVEALYLQGETPGVTTITPLFNEVPKLLTLTVAG